MLGNIVAIENEMVTVKLAIDISSQANLINLHIIFEDNRSNIVGEIKQAHEDTIKIAIVGELVSERFVPGSSKKPSFRSDVRMIKMEELSSILGSQQIVSKNQVYFGLSSIYKNYRINVDVNKFFSNHFAILGNTGAGKSFTVARLIQNLFLGSSYVPVNSNLFVFDAYGEYTDVFEGICEKNPLLRNKTYTTNIREGKGDFLKIPIWLLDVDDIAQLLGVDQIVQLPIIEKALRLVRILSSKNPNLNKRKNDIIARALLDVLLSGKDSGKIRDQVTAVLTNFNTEQLNLNSEVKEPGYTRTLKQCLFTDKTGQMQEVGLVVDFVNTFISEEADKEEIIDESFYTLTDLEKALEFALISEGVLKSNRVFDYANILSVRLHSLVNSDYAKIFECNQYMSETEFIKSLLTANDGKKAQIVNFNIHDVDDRMAKAITKIISHLLFRHNVEALERAKEPFHIIIEEAHRYVQNDSDAEIFGYNIFDRITKEGRKYGVILGLITQRLSELSETATSQCSNFIILRTVHPKDLKFMENMISSVSSDMVESLKTLQAGSCIAFGSAFLVPVMMKFEKPTPEPRSHNADLTNLWY